MKDVFETLLSHRSIRKFQTTPVPVDVQEQIFNAAFRTASSRAIQNTSVIRVTDQAKRDALAQVCRQPYTAQAPEFLVFIVDVARAMRILEEKGVSPEAYVAAPTMDTYREAYTDACLLAQSTVVGAEALGLGTVLLGSILNDPTRTIEILEMPKYTFPVLGLLMGYPDQEPELKPRIPNNLRFMQNHYQAPDSWTEALGEYDREMNNYYDLRSANQREDTYTNQVVTKMTHPDPRRALLLEDIKNQGFLV